MTGDVKALPDRMTIRRAGEAIRPGPDTIATGPIWVEMLLDSAQDGENTAMRATYAPGVISHWHSHPLGQMLHVLDGVGLVQRDGGPVIEVRPGDNVWFAPGERHWHGAAKDGFFVYLSVQAVQGGVAATWMEPVAAPPR